ncbi:hypothetical protein FJZ53_06260 [Candidatus Woesearchaeota archaeon]|nr:hypothetical protein [Candidatus Woesearchaeota archaeon]
MVTITTIKVYSKTKVSLNAFKEYDKESYDHILEKLLYLAHLIKQNPELGKKFLEEIEATKKALEKRHNLRKVGQEMVMR